MSSELLQAAACVILGVKRSWFLVLGVALAGRILGLFFEQVSAVGKQQAAEGHATLGAVEPAAEPLLDQRWKEARMIQVLVGQEIGRATCRERGCHNV